MYKMKAGKVKNLDFIKQWQFIIKFPQCPLKIVMEVTQTKC